MATERTICRRTFSIAIQDFLFNATLNIERVAIECVCALIRMPETRLGVEGLENLLKRVVFLRKE